jgi:hypothetical protein
MIEYSDLSVYLILPSIALVVWMAYCVYKWYYRRYINNGLLLAQPLQPILMAEQASSQGQNVPLVEQPNSSIVLNPMYYNNYQSYNNVPFVNEPFGSSSNGVWGDDSSHNDRKQHDNGSSSNGVWGDDSSHNDRKQHDNEYRIDLQKQPYDPYQYTGYDSTNLPDYQKSESIVQSI